MKCSLVISISASLVGLTASAHDRSEDREYVAAVAEACLQNREGARPLVMKFRYSKGLSRNADYARKGRFKVPPATANCSLWEEASRRRFERLAVNEVNALELATESGQNVVSVPFHSKKILEFDGEVDAGYSPRMNTMAIRPGNDDKVGISGTPFDAGLMGKGEAGHPARKILAAVASDDPEIEVSEVEVEGERLVRVRLPMSGYRGTVFFHPDKGFLPVAIEYRRTADDSLAFEMTVVQVAEMAEHFYPARVRRIGIGAGNAKRECVLEEWIVDECVIGEKIADEEFAITTPPGVRIHNGTNPRGQFGLTKAWVMNKSELLRFREHTFDDNVARRKQQNRDSVSRASSPAPKSIPFWSIAMANLVLLATILGVLYLRSQKAAKTGEMTK